MVETTIPPIRVRVRAKVRVGVRAKVRVRVKVKVKVRVRDRVSGICRGRNDDTSLRSSGLYHTTF